MIRIFIAEDQKMFSEGIMALLQTEKDFVFVGSATNGIEAYKQILELKPSICLLDINMPEMDGITLSTKLKSVYPELPILILTTYDHPQFIRNLLAIGVNGYLIKNAPKSELIEAIRSVVSGNNWFSPQVMDQVKETLEEISGHPENIRLLSKRELEVLGLIGKGMSSPEIAEKLFLSTHTVDTHRKNLLAKLGLSNSAALVKYANDRGLSTGE
jgi:DNA-binding NarL/FixJ family response regulator